MEMREQTHMHMHAHTLLYTNKIDTGLACVLGGLFFKTNLMKFNMFSDYLQNLEYAEHCLQGYDSFFNLTYCLSLSSLIQKL